MTLFAIRLLVQATIHYYIHYILNSIYNYHISEHFQSFAHKNTWSLKTDKLNPLINSNRVVWLSMWSVKLRNVLALPEKRAPSFLSAKRALSCELHMPKKSGNLELRQSSLGRWRSEVQTQALPPSAQYSHRRSTRLGRARHPYTDDEYELYIIYPRLLTATVHPQRRALRVSLGISGVGWGSLCMCVLGRVHHAAAVAGTAIQAADPHICTDERSSSLQRRERTQQWNAQSPNKTKQRKKNLNKDKQRNFYYLLSFPLPCCRSLSPLLCFAPPLAQFCLFFTKGKKNWASIYTKFEYSSPMFLKLLYLLFQKSSTLIHNISSTQQQFQFSEYR